MSIPSNEDILALLAQLDDAIADALESEFLDFKPSLGPKEDLKVACEYAVCFANAAGGVVVFGVADKQRVGKNGMPLDRVAFQRAHTGVARVRRLSFCAGAGVAAFQEMVLTRRFSHQECSAGEAVLHVALR